ncbi:unnamed protein product [Pleuronectes platessa]|uniref:Uncharacterized protein n=1 Tax=Pleuronectes platessa TaxID=8262 RepID=A0A9N7UA37_PLEPL|nr:unnamed protein product [Pleuronectes platessa]
MLHEQNRPETSFFSFFSFSFFFFFLASILHRNPPCSSGSWPRCLRCARCPSPLSPARQTLDQCVEELILSPVGHRPSVASVLSSPGAEAPECTPRCSGSHAGTAAGSPPEKGIPSPAVLRLVSRCVPVCPGVSRCVPVRGSDGGARSVDFREGKRPSEKLQTFLSRPLVKTLTIKLPTQSSDKPGFSSDLLNSPQRLLL